MLAFTVGFLGFLGVVAAGTGNSVDSVCRELSCLLAIEVRQCGAGRSRMICGPKVTSRS
jgi:hypothetical protein